MIGNVLWFLLGFGVLFVIVCLWFAVHYWLNPHIENPDGRVRITGSCGDTMEISLKFKRNQVVDTSYWTDGCAYSLNCVFAATDLAMGKNPDEIIDIDASLIQKSIGGLPKDYQHCAKLAEDTLQAALDDYMLKCRNKTCHKCSRTTTDFIPP